MPGRRYLVLWVALLLLSSSCTAPEADYSPAPQARINVTVSILPQQYFVERIGGDRVSVSVMVPPGFSPETYEPRPSQIGALAAAQVYIRIRVPFEDAWLERFVSANRHMLIVDQSEGIDRIDGTDPHIWLSPRLAKIQARTICDGLIVVDPDGESLYRANLEALLTDIDTLDADIRDTLSGLEGRKFIVLHPAWAYFARDYGLEMIPIAVGGSEPSAAEMTRLVQTARENNIRVVFAQPEFSTKSAETIAQEIGGRVLLISPLAPDWLDNLRLVADTLAAVLAEQG
jgi:zinc transport system substrate-binding protein